MRHALGAVLAAVCFPVWAQPGVTPAASAPAVALPLAVEKALQRAKVPREALSAVVMEAGTAKGTRLSYQAEVSANPASVMKLVTTYAALDLLGPAYTWETPVYLDAAPQAGSLRGNVYIQGQGDPQLVVEKLWLMMRRLQAQGVQVIVGDIVLDRSAFDLPPHDPAQFDGEPWRPYNVSPDALLINFKSAVMRFVPEPAAGVARVQYEPPLAGITLPTTVPLAPAGTECGDWRTGLRGELGDPRKLSFAGSFPASCGERQWPVALADPDNFAARAVEGMWRELGGKLTGSVRFGKVPAGLKPAFSVTSPALSEVVRDINKYSNNVMTQQLFLTLGLRTAGSGTWAGGRQAIAQWWQQRWPQVTPPLVDNGSGLSRSERVTAQGLARMLDSAWASPVMPELMASLPVAGVDGTLRRVNTRAQGQAHMKPGTLRDVTAMAGYVHAASGKRYIVVGIINHALAPAARPALHALVEWAAQDAPASAMTASTASVAKSQ